MNSPIKFFKEYRKRKEYRKQYTEDFFGNFKVELLDNDIVAECGFKNEDFVKWINMMHNFIQLCLGKNKLIKNYIMSGFQLGGQEVEFYIIKDGQPGPHKIRMALEEENKILKKRIEELEGASDKESLYFNSITSYDFNDDKKLDLLFKQLEIDNIKSMIKKIKNSEMGSSAKDKLLDSYFLKLNQLTGE